MPNADAPITRLFGTDGVRAVAGEPPLDRPTVRRFGAALVRALPKGPGPLRLLLGRDTRESGGWIEAELAAGARGEGASVVSAGVAPTPAIAYLTRQAGYDAGVVISASHNLYADNGIKVFSGRGEKFTAGVEREVEEIVADRSWMVKGGEAGLVERVDLLQGYRDHLAAVVSDTAPFTGFKLAIDCANGATATIAPELFRALGFDTVVMANAPDGRNINLGCGSTAPAALADAVVETGCRMGVAFDGDGDRAIFVDDQGHVVNGDTVLFLCARQLQREGRLRGNAIAATVMSNIGLERGLNALGIGVERCDVGDKHVTELMLARGLSLGGEQSGHVIFSDYLFTGDGLCTALNVLRTVSLAGRTLADLASDLVVYPQVLLNVRVRDKADLDKVPDAAAAIARVESLVAGQGGRRVVLIDHAAKVAEKIRISGGGRCNFTNLAVAPANFLSENPNFCRSALARYTPQDFLALMQRHGIAWHEKHRGQLFCDGSSEAVIAMLLAECAAGAVTRWQPCNVQALRNVSGGFELHTDHGPLNASRVVIATGGLSIPQIGASDFGYRVARQFGHTVVQTRPALVPLTFQPDAWSALSVLAGLSLEVEVQAGEGRQRGEFVEDMLFTHRGLSGPAVLQISSYWRQGESLRIDLAPGIHLPETLLRAKTLSQRQLGNELGTIVPARVAQAWLRNDAAMAATPMPQQRDRDLRRLAQQLKRWEVTPSGSEGYRKAEVTAGGVCTRELSSQTLQSQRVPGLYFIGEVVDVTGWLGGYNFQWAWASAAACARALLA